MHACPHPGFRSGVLYGGGDDIGKQGANAANLPVGTGWVDPVTEQNQEEPAVRVDPDGCSRKTRMAEATRPKQAAGRGVAPWGARVPTKCA